MKKIFAFAGFVIALVAPSIAQADEVISFSRLPQSAQAFVQKYFGTKQISKVKLDREVIYSTYEVKFSDGSEVEFDKSGNWREVNCEPQAVPQALIPSAITQYVAQHYNNSHIVQIEKKGNGSIQVELSSGEDLLFDARMKLRKVDD